MKIKTIEKCTVLSNLVFNIIISSDGAERSGIYIAISNLMEQFKLENSIDVFQTVKKIRAARPEFISDEVKTLINAANKILEKIIFFLILYILTEEKINLVKKKKQFRLLELDFNIELYFNDDILYNIFCSGKLIKIYCHLFHIEILCKVKTSF